MGIITFDRTASGKVFAIGANRNYLRHFVNEFVGAGGSPESLVVIRDSLHCPEPVCTDIAGTTELAIEAGCLDATIGALKTCGDVGCVFAWHHLISRNVIDAFAGRLYNLHYGDLPRYRGAGGGSWQVLNGETCIKAFVHCMTPELDLGDVLMQEMEPFACDDPYPRHVKEAAGRASFRIIRRLAALMYSGGRVNTVQQDEVRALYFPRLDSARNGWIDFSWSSANILRFVRAFSDPYPGASFRYRNACYRVRRASLRNKECLHPFAIGLIVNRTKEGVHVAVADGVLVFSDIRAVDGNSCGFDAFRVGGRVRTQASDLSDALQYRPGATR